MTKPKDNESPTPLPGGEPARQRPCLLKCPHCGRFVTPEEPAEAAPVLRCPSCGLEIKERHLA
jgi:DNA-directed RNA polymerase subunit RPC12/RpoP